MEFDLEKAKYAGIALSIAGFVALVLLLPEDTYTPIRNIGESDAGAAVKISGTVMGAEPSGRNVFFTLDDGARIKAAVFRATQDELAAIKNGAIVEARGKISVYKGRPELIVEEVRRIG